MAKAPTSLRDKVTPIAAGAEVVACGFLGRTPVLALADGVVLVGDRRVVAHDGAVVLVARCDGKRMVTGGDDGRVVDRAEGSWPATLDRLGSGWVPIGGPPPLE